MMTPSLYKGPLNLPEMDSCARDLKEFAYNIMNYNSNSFFFSLY